MQWGHFFFFFALCSEPDLWYLQALFSSWVSLPLTVVLDAGKAVHFPQASFPRIPPLSCLWRDTHARLWEPTSLASHALSLLTTEDFLDYHLVILVILLHINLLQMSCFVLSFPPCLRNKDYTLGVTCKVTGRGQLRTEVSRSQAQTLLCHLHSIENGLWNSNI